MSEHSTHDGFREQFPKNLFANIAFFLVSILIGILLVPYFIDTLGIAAYGLIPLVSAVTGYVAIVVQSLNTTVSRYLTIDLQRHDYPAANRTFNTAFFGLCVVIAFMIPVVLIISYFVPVIFSVPAGQETGAIILFICVSAAFFIRSLNGTFTVQLFAFNRLDLINIVNLVNLLVQVGLIVLFFWLKGPNLTYVGVAYLIGAIVASVIAIILAKNICPQLHLSLSSFDHSRVKDLGNMGVWVFINEIGVLLFLQMDLILVNILFGSSSAGEYAIVLQLSVQLRTIAGVLVGLLSPMILTFFARHLIETMVRVTKSAVKLMGLTLALPIGLVCGFSPQLLTLWVGAEYAFLAPLLVLMTVHLIVNLAILPLISIRFAYNQVKIPALVTLFMGVFNFVLAIILSLYTGWGYYGVAAAGIIALTLTNVFFNPWYTSRILKVPVDTFLRPLIPGIFALAGIIGVTVVFSFFLNVYSLALLFVVMSAISMGYLIALLLFGFNHFERNLLYSYMPPFLKNLFLHWTGTNEM